MASEFSDVSRQIDEYNSAMPGSTAIRGDIYKVKPTATLEGRDHAAYRPMVCVAELPADTVWRGMSRTSTAGDPSDLPSAADPSLGFTKTGWWSFRYLRSVKKRWTGHATECPFVTTLVDPLKTQVLDHYKNRPRPVAGDW